MGEIINKYNIYINTSQRVSGDPDNFTIQFERPILLSSDKTHFEIFLTTLEYPYNFYQVNNNNNTFLLNLFISNVFSGSFTIQITEGNYNIFTLLEEVKNKILFFTNLFSVEIQTTYSKITGRATFNTTDTIHRFDCEFANNHIGLMLGFTTNISIQFNSPQIANQHCNVNPTTFICIRSPELVSTNSDMESISSTSNNSDILCKVPVRSPPSSYIYYEQPFEDRIFCKSGILSNINFFVTNNTSRNLIGNGGLNFSFSLCILEVINSSFEQYNFIKEPSNINQVNDLLNMRSKLVQNLKTIKNKIQEE